MAQIILKENVRNLGKIGQVVDVTNGYAFNFLIPQNKALPATEANLAILEQQKTHIIQEDQKKKEIAQALVQKLPSHIYIAKEVNENGLLYGSITAKDILDEIKAVTGKHSVHFNHHINKYGVYPVEIELHHDVTVNILLSISDTVENAKKQVSNTKSDNPKNSQKNSEKPTE